jgi:peptide/nickel transport system permease protein
MLVFIARRLAIAALTMLVISVLAFVVIQLPPGDYLSSYMARLQSQGDSVAQDQIEALREQYGLDQPLYMQYLKWIGGVLQGNFGRSLEWDVPVSDLLGQPLLHTIILASSAMLLTWIIALPIGVYSAVRQRSIGDYVFTFIGFLGLAIPDFMLALLLMFGCYSLFGINVSGLFSPEYIDAPWSWGSLRSCGADSHAAGKFARRTAKALCGDGPRQGAAVLESGPQVSAADRTEPARQYVGLYSTALDFRQRHRVGSA